MLRTILAVSVLTLAVPAIAEQPSYDFINASFQSVEIDVGTDVDGDGFGIGGSYKVAENWHILGSYTSIGFDFGIDLNQLSLGGGYHTSISETTSFFANLSYVNFEVDTGAFGSVDDSGYGVAIGLRSNVNERVELEGAITLIDLGNGGNTTSFGGSGWYEFESFSLGLTAEFDEDITSFGIGGRFYFGQ